MYDVEIYETLNGKSEVKEYILDMQKKNNKESKIKFKKIIAYIRMLREEGLSLGEPYIKHIDDKIWELRPLRDRILFASHINNKFILVTIFIKKHKKHLKKKLKRQKDIILNIKKGVN